MKVLISLFDHSGNWSKPYEDNNWIVKRVDIKSGIDILTWDYETFLDRLLFGEKDIQIAIMAAVPCTDYALCGAKWFAAKDADGRTDFSNSLLLKTKEIIDFIQKRFNLLFWVIENPASRIHKLNPWLGQPLLKFQPFHYAGYDPEPINSQYGKFTWLWGKFNEPLKRELPCLLKGMDRHSQWGGKSEKTKEMRSVTPLGFAYAFYEANN